MSIMSLFACASSGGVKSDNDPITDAMWNKVAEIEYDFGDSSVAPEYHRSYSILVTQTEATIRVTSYGDVLLEKTYKMTPAQWQKVIENLKKLNIRRCEVCADPCDGGQSEYFVFRSADKSEQPIFTGRQDTCGSSNVDVAFEAVSYALNAAFPKPINDIVESTIEQ